MKQILWQYFKSHMDDLVVDAFWKIKQFEFEIIFYIKHVWLRGHRERESSSIDYTYF